VTWTDDVANCPDANNKATLCITKGLTIIGAGAGNTNITLDPSTCTTGDQFSIAYHPDYTKNETFRLSGFRFTRLDNCKIFEWGKRGQEPLTDDPAIIPSNIRVDNNEFISAIGSTQIVTFRGLAYGVFDNNTLNIAGYAFRSDTVTVGDEYWNHLSFTIGDANNVYIENNTITNSAALPVMTSQNGIKWVIRYNSITNSNASGIVPVIDLHGNTYSGCVGGSEIYSSQGMEFYGNDYLASANASLNGFIDLRGGQAIIHHNTGRTTDATFSMKFREECSDSGNTPSIPTNLITGQTQHISGTYLWSTRKDTSGALMTYAETDPVGAIAENTDYFTHDESFDGTSGMGCGTLGARPATCTTGVGYWATTQSCSDLTNMVGANPSTPISGTLYKCTATDTWGELYTPYIYPHPLTVGFSSVSIGITTSGATIQ
jgi:hypothetical protein